MDAADFPRLIEALTDPAVYPHPVGRVRHLETHISHVLLAGDFAYKLKKPVDLGFLDFSTLDLRRHYCEEAIRLDRRLAAWLNPELVTLTGRPEAPRIDGDGPLLEYAVRMRRFEQDQLLDRSKVTPEIIDQLADLVADFHAEIPIAPADSPYGTPDAVLAPMRENLRQVRAQAVDLEQSQRMERLTAWTEHRWRSLTPVLRSRRAGGHVRECHGDLHRGNIAMVEGRPLLFDALEFSPNLRWIDTASELAFMVMDLEEAGEVSMARRLLNRYLERGGDYGAIELLDFYKVYRAMVRAKVRAIRLRQTAPGTGEARAERLECRRYLELAESYTRVRRPRLLITCGLSGSGKSRLGRKLREALPLIHLRSDVERKRLFAGLADGGPAGVSDCAIYSSRATERTYGRLAELAGSILDAGYDVLVDATFLSRKRRLAFRDLARWSGARFAILAMAAPIPILRERVVRRLEEGSDVSEATLRVLEGQIAAYESLDRGEREYVIEIDTSDPLGIDEVLERILALTRIPLDR